MEKMNFTDIKEAYVQNRREQWEQIRNYLAKQPGFTVPTTKRGGCGLRDYGGRGRLPRFSTPYDLSDWQYIDVETEGMKYLISFQSFDLDPSSKEYHVLANRLGIYLYMQGRNKTSDAIHRMMVTQIDLPMDEKKLQELADTIKTITKYRKRMDKAHEKFREMTEAIRMDMEKEEIITQLVPVEQGLFEQLFADGL